MSSPGQPTRLLRWRGGAWAELVRGRSNTEQLWGWGGADDSLWLLRGTDRTFDLYHRVGETETRISASRVLSGRFHDVVPELDGSFWIATSLGAQRYGPPPWRPVPGLADGIPARAIGEAPDGRVFVLCDNRLATRDRGGAWSAVALPVGRQPSLTEPHALAWLQQRLIVYLPSGPSLAFEGGSARFTPLPSLGLPPRQSRLIGAANGQEVWTSSPTDSGVRLGRFDGEQIRTEADVPSPPFRTSLRAALLAADGTLWVGSTEGVARRTADGWQVFDRSQAYLGLGAFSLLEVDREIWVGHRTGIAAFDGTRWRSVLGDVETVRSLVRARDGTLWAATGSALLRYIHGSWIKLAPEQGLPDANVEAVYETAAGDVMVGTSHGLWQWHPDADHAAPRTSGGASPVAVAAHAVAELSPSAIDQWAVADAPLLYSWRRRDGTWSPFARGPLTTEQLPIGAHDIQIRAMDTNFNVAGTPVSLRVTVLRPWYREPFVMILSALSAIITAALGWSYVARHRDLEHTVALRTQQLAEVNLQLEADLRAREAAEDEARRLEAQLRTSQKLEAVGQLSGGIAHDFNNLLTIVIGCASLLKKRIGRNASTHQLLEEILDAGERASGLTRQLLAFSQRTVVELRVFDLNGSVQETSRLLRRLLPPNIALAVVPIGRP